MISKTSILEKRLVQDMITGKYPVGTPIPSRNRLATKYGCSRTTVERAIDSLTANGYLRSVKGSGTYVASIHPDHKITSIRFVAGYYGSRPVDFFSELVLSGDPFEYPITWFNERESAERFEQLAMPGGAVIWMLPGEEQLFIMDALRDKHIPQLLFNRQYRNYDCVFTDPVSSIREGLAWLLIEGGRDIAFISRTCSVERPYLHHRIIAFYEQAIAFGAHMRGDWIFSRDFLDIPHEIEEIAGKLFSGNHPRGIFVMNFELVLPLVMAAQHYKKKLGKDYFLLTFDSVAELVNTPGVGMLCQPYKQFRQEMHRWLASGAAQNGQVFSVALKCDFQHW